MSGAPHGVYTIAPGRAFLTDLAEGLVARFARDGDPLALADATIFLPTRRAARALAEALTKAMNRDAVVLPRIVTLGDVDEDEALIDPAADLGGLPPDVPRLEREMILAERVAQFRHEAGSSGGFGVSLALARSLARLIDEAANEDADLSGIAALAPVDLAQHWEKTVAFLALVTTAWPALLETRGQLDPADRRSRLIRAYAQRLQDRRPEAPFIVAGSSGSIRATADLMKVIAGLPNGAVVLDGLDTVLDALSWSSLPPSHPQFALKELLDRLGIDRMAVGPWPGSADAPTARQAFLTEAMRPPDTADLWASAARDNAKILSAGVSGVSLIEAANEREEALAVALAMRRTLEDPEKTVALVTPDRMLARRVAAELRRWDIAADDSAGLPLVKTEAGALAGLALAAAMTGGAPVDLLALMKHPRAALGLERGAMLRLARRFERRVLRPARVTGGFADMRAALGELDDKGASARKLDDAAREALSNLLRAGEDALAPLAALKTGTHRLERFAAAHAAVLENIARNADGKSIAWRSGDGEAVFTLMQDIAEAGAGGVTMTLGDYAIAFDIAARGAAVRPQGPRHPRVFIWGPLEARMQSADLMILGGLNEGVWPQNPSDDPWLTRGMREALTLSAPERRIGLSAHDFATMAAQPDVLLTRARRQDGAPSNASRFLLRLTALAEGCGAPIPRDGVLDLARGIDASERPRPAPRPMPRPPHAARPRGLSVTQIETWVRDPYAIYAREVLGLKKLDAIAEPLGARDRGNIIHKAFELFAERRRWPDDPYEALVACGREAFGGLLDAPDVRAFWWPRYLRAARFLAEAETEWATTRAHTLAEVKEVHHFTDIDFKLTGKPDRIDRLTNGGVRVIDYKTGGIPSKKQIEAFMAPQLPLLAAMARAGAFGAEMKGPPAELVYAHISGGKVDGKMVELPDAEATTDELERRLKERVVKFDDTATPYAPRVAMEKIRYPSDYDHLSRFAEWGEAAEGEE
ncbi:MAG: double-strand break repair protein AddB [Micropepsaceae bacterium]